MRHLKISVALLLASIGYLSGCIVPAPVPVPASEVYVDEFGYRHEGYYDRDHHWHGGYYDRDHHHHDDPADWHHDRR